MGEEQQFKPEAKCAYHSLCALYNNGALSLEVEVAMCGRGRYIDKTYEPQIPKPAEFIPSEHYPLGPSGTCDSYLRYYDDEIITLLVRQIDTMKELLEKHGRW